MELLLFGFGLAHELLSLLDELVSRDSRAHTHPLEDAGAQRLHVVLRQLLEFLISFNNLLERFSQCFFEVDVVSRRRRGQIRG